MGRQWMPSYIIRQNKGGNCSMNKKDIKKIIIPVIAMLVIVVGLVSYFMKPQEAQPAMAPIDTQQSLVEDKEEITPSPKLTAEPTPTPTPTSTPEPTPTPDDGINSTHDDVILGDDEYKGDDEISDEVIDDIAEQIFQEILQEHSEWQNSAGTQQGNYEHVGTPDSGAPIPEFDMTGDFSQLGDNVTVY